MRLAVRRATSAVAAVLVAGIVPVVGADPAAGTHVAATVDAAFNVAAFLSQFPCPTGCSASFGGNGAATGSLHATRHEGTYDASFTIPDAMVLGYAEYTEPGFPTCPAAGFAAGSVNVVGTAFGVVTRTGLSPATGAVQALSMQLNFTYVRAGLTAAVTVIGGTATVWYDFPDGSGSFTGDVLGGGPTTFGLGAYQAPLNCLAPNSLWMTFHGNVALAVT